MELELLFYSDKPYAIEHISPTGEALIGKQDGFYYLLSNADEPSIILPIERATRKDYSFFSQDDGWIYVYELTQEGTSNVYRLLPDGSQLLPLHDVKKTDFITFSVDQDWMLLYQNGISETNNRTRRIVRKQTEGTDLSPITEYYAHDYFVFVQAWFQVPDQPTNWLVLIGGGLGLIASSFGIYKAGQRRVEG